MHKTHRLVIVLGMFFLIFYTPPTHAYKKGIITTLAISLSIASIYGFYRWLRSEEQFQPTIDNLNTYTITQRKNIHTAASQDDISAPFTSIDQLVIDINQKKSPQQARVKMPHNHAFNKKILHINKGITLTPEDHTVFIFSRGYARTNTPWTNDNVLQIGGCIMAAYMPVHDNVINNAPCITFDYPDRRRCFNFGQDKDVLCLQHIHKQVLKQNPTINIILIGDCRGAKAILNFATQQPKNIKALVLLSPFFSAQELTEQVALNYLSWLPKSSNILHNFFTLWFPSYNTKADTTFLQNINKISPQIPIFIAHRNYDTLVSTQQVIHFIDQLKQAGHTHITFVTTNDTSARHSRITPIKEIQQEANLFFHKYGLPHNLELLTA